MKEPDHWEEQLQSWIPRRPSAKIAARLFEQPAAAVNLSRCAESLNWLTPAAACLLTMFVFLGVGNRHPAQFGEKDNATFFATLMLDAASSSNAAQQTFTLSKMDVNLEWNVWPHAAIFKSTNPSPSSSTINFLPVAMTNRLTP